MGVPSLGLPSATKQLSNFCQQADAVFDRAAARAENNLRSGQAFRKGANRTQQTPSEYDGNDHA
jgi:hypothetical protein